MHHPQVSFCATVANESVVHEMGVFRRGGFSAQGAGVDLLYPPLDGGIKHTAQDSEGLCAVIDVFPEMSGIGLA